MRQPNDGRFNRRQQPPPLSRLNARDPRLPLIAIAAAIVLVLMVWVLFLPPLGLLRGGDDWKDAGEELVVRRADSVPRLPEGFQLASPFYEIRSRQDRGVGPASITVPLAGGQGGRGLAMWTHAGDSWRQLGPAEIEPDGKSAKAQVDQVPENIAVMRREAGGFQVQGILAPGANLMAGAEKLIQVRSPMDFAPLPDGSISGAPTPRAARDAIAQIPIVRATAGAEAQAVNEILANEQTRAAHVAALAATVRDNRLDGLDLEYTAIEPNHSSAFTAFITALAAELHRTGQTLTVALPVPRREGGNWNTYGYDWKALGAVADNLRIMPERDQSIYRRTLRDALNYVTGLVDSRKLILTISPLASEKSEQGTRTMTAVEALSIAAQITVPDRDRLAAGTEIELRANNLIRDTGQAGGLIWDANAAAVSFVYQSAEGPRTVWIENIYSAAFKLEYVQVWNLGGVAVDDASDTAGTSNIWPAIDDFLKNGNKPTLLQPNPSPMRPTWYVDGQSREAALAIFKWKAPPDPGDHTITLHVGDGVIRVVNSIRVNLRPGPPPAQGGAGIPGARTPTPATGR